MAMLYTHAIGNQPWNTMVVFKMRESVPTARYLPVCNVLRQWKTSLILTYRFYRLYDIHFMYKVNTLAYKLSCIKATSKFRGLPIEPAQVALLNDGGKD